MEARRIDPHKYLTYLAETDEAYAQARAAVKAAEYTLKVVKAKEYLAHTGTQAEREQVAYASEDYQKVLEDLRDVTREAETMAAKRKTAELAIEVFRSLNANQRRGNI